MVWAILSWEAATVVHGCWYSQHHFKVFNPLLVKKYLTKIKSMHHANIIVFQINSYTLWSHLLVTCMPVHNTDITWGQKQRITNKKTQSSHWNIHSLLNIEFTYTFHHSTMWTYCPINPQQKTIARILTQMNKLPPIHPPAPPKVKSALISGY